MADLLQVKGLSVAIQGREVVRDASFGLEEGGTLGIVGESGSGKSMTALALMGLLPRGAAISSGSVLFQGRELRGLSEPEYRKLRGGQISMVFQEPFTCLNPVQRIGAQVAEVLQLHRGLDKGKALAEAVGWLEKVGIPDAGARARQYPHQWSGGMRQRAMIAMAMACHPRLLIADEPTTALDVTVQAQILDLLKRMVAEFGVALILISHDLGVIQNAAGAVAVMKDGRIVEAGPASRVFSPKAEHPYTRSLLGSYMHWAGR